MVKIDFENSNTKFCLVFILAELVSFYDHELYDHTTSFYLENSDIMDTNVYLDLDNDGSTIVLILENKNKDKIITKKQTDKPRIFEYIYHDDIENPEPIELSEYDVYSGNIIRFFEVMLHDLINEKIIKFKKELTNE